MKSSLVILVAFAISAEAQAGFVFQDDFESGAASSAFSGAGDIESAQGFSSFGFDGLFLRNSTDPDSQEQKTTLTLTDLPTHSSIDLGFSLALIDSWDSSGRFGPDYFNVVVNGVTVFRETFGTATGFPHAPLSAYQLSLRDSGPDGIVLSDDQDLFGSSFYESAYEMSLEPALSGVPHSSDELVIEWFADGPNWQGGTDESWAIDNVTVSLNSSVTAVPEPAGLVIWLGSFGALAFFFLLRSRANRAASSFVRQSPATSS